MGSVYTFRQCVYVPCGGPARACGDGLALTSLEPAANAMDGLGDMGIRGTCDEHIRDTGRLRRERRTGRWVDSGIEGVLADTHVNKED